MRRTLDDWRSIKREADKAGWSQHDIAKRLGCSRGTIASAFKRVDDQWGEEGRAETVASGCNTMKQDATPAEVMRPRPTREHLVRRVTEELTEPQTRAIWLLLDGARVMDVAEKCNVHRTTISQWKGDPLFAAILSDLRAERDMAATEAIVAGATEGVDATREALSIALDALRNAAGSEHGSADLKEIASLSRAVIQAAASLMDRGGKPKTETINMAQADAGHDRTRDPREVLREELGALPSGAVLRLVGE